MRNCIDEGTLQAWFDGELAANQAANVTAHVKTCVRCAEAARLLEDENLILSEGLAAEFATAIPTERLRQRVDAAVAGPQVVSGSKAKPSPWRSMQLFFASFRPMAYASMAAAILLAVFLAVVFLKQEPGPAPISQENHGGGVPATPPASPEQTAVPVGVTPPKRLPSHAPKTIKRNREPETPATSLSWQERQYERAIAKLNEAIQTQPPLRPALKVEYEYNLALIENAIATTREVARKNPNDPQATQFMLAAYQSKIDLMNQIADARVLER